MCGAHAQVMSAAEVSIGLRVDGATQTYAFTARSAPWTYRFVAPDAPASGATFTLRAIATDHSNNESAAADG